MDAKERLTKLTEINNEQNIKLARLEVHSERLSQIVERLAENHDELVKISSANSESLKHHVKRTDILQNRQYKIIMALSCVIGIVTATMGPKLLGLLGILL
jgi:hypothetical protein